MKSELRIELLGHFRLQHDGRAVEGLTSRQQALLACLLLNRHRPQSRRQLACLFWPGSTDGQALTNLRRELYHVRRALPDPDRFLLIKAATLQWRPDAPFTCDVSQFEASVEHAGLDQLQDAARLYLGDLLPDCYDEWIIAKREHLQTRHVVALKRLVVLLDEQRRYAEAIRPAQQLLALEPLDEETYRTLMRLHALAGDRAGALRVYHKCATVLARELGVDPDAVTRAAHEHLLEAGSAASPPTFSVRRSSFIGRDEEWARLLEALQAAAGGQARVVLIRGEAGIGKTRLVEELHEWCVQQGIAAASTRSYAAEGRLAYAPVVDWLRSPGLRPALERLESPWRADVARLLPELAPGHVDPPPEPLREGWQRQRLFEALAHAIMCVSPPVLLVLDDLQWCDQDTLEWLHYLLRTRPEARLLVVCTLRTEDAADNPAVGAQLTPRPFEQLIEIDLDLLNRAETAALAEHIIGQPLDSQAAARLYTQTEGHPLFVVEITRAGLDEPALPRKMQTVIAARLSRLSTPARELVALAATVGRDFSFAVLSGASDFDERTLVAALDELWRRRIVREHGVHGYDFSHDRVREVAYAEISPPARRSLHKRVAQTLELLHGTDLDGVSAQVAAHYEQAGQTLKAVQFYRLAAEVASRVSAVEEAIRHYYRALALLPDRPESLERDRQELSLLLALMASLGAGRAVSAETETALSRVKVLGESLMETEPVVQGLTGLSGLHIVRGNYAESLACAEEALRLAERLAPDQSTLRASSHFAAVPPPFLAGEFARARHHIEQITDLCDPGQLHLMVYGPDALAFAMAFEAHVVWLLGYPDQAIERTRAAITRAEQIRHPQSLSVAHAYGTLACQFRRDRVRSRAHATTTLELCARYGLVYYGEWGTIVDGWARSQEHPGEDGVAEIRRGLDNLKQLGSHARRPYYLYLLADALALAGRVEEACAALDAAMAMAVQTNDVWWSPELHRLRGELSDDQETWFLQALEIARSQCSRSLELRSAVSLGRLWSGQGKRESARALVAPVFEWFTEGFDTLDLAEARALLTAL